MTRTVGHSMGKIHPAIDESLAEFLGRQHLFFVATAPLGPDGHLNLSPKGMDTFLVVDAHTVAYLDLTGSGIETVAHLRENGRIAFLFCAFEGPPRIVRLHGLGDVLEPGDPEFDELRRRFPGHEGARAIVRARLNRISDSCGYAVPLFSYQGERDQLLRWAERKGADGLTQYRNDNNARSIDGLPGLRRR